MMRRGRAIERLSQPMGHISQLTLDSMTFADTSRDASRLGIYLHMEKGTPEAEGEHGSGRPDGQVWKGGRWATKPRIGPPSGRDCLKRMHVKAFGPAEDAAVQTGRSAWVCALSDTFPSACLHPLPARLVVSLYAFYGQVSLTIDQLYIGCIGKDREGNSIGAIRDRSN